ncbi:uncharacterized protein V2V93DRAFT_202394 [Kockiozyma suomiensis]|uniref:uncharacterized protein n=1 Tax=Kockiozyma suomiensis TaxID=1337062 RepID=UPI003343172E
MTSSTASSPDDLVSPPQASDRIHAGVSEDYRTSGGFEQESPSLHRMPINRSSASAMLSSVFSPNYQSLDREFDPSAHVSTPQLHAAPSEFTRLSSAQQSKLINYLDDQLLQISRRFVRKSSLSDDDGESIDFETTPKDQHHHTAYTTIEPMIADLTELVDLIWYSVPSTPVPFIQVQYLLRIADDFNDCVPQLPITEPEKLFIFLKMLDLIFYELIEGNIPSRARMGNTEKARLEGIAERTRLDVLECMNGFRGYELDVTRVYDKVLEVLN